MSADGDDEASLRPGARPVWLPALALSVLGLGAADAVLLELAQTYFSGGYNGVYLERAGEIAAFFGLGLVLDAWLFATLWLLLRAVLAPLRLGGARLLAAVGAGAVALPLGIDAGRYQIHTIVGDALPLGLVFELAGREVGSFAAEAGPQLGAFALGGGFALVAIVALVFGAGHAERWLARHGWHPELPSARASALWATALGAAAVVIMAVTPGALARVNHGFLFKPSGTVIVNAVALATDVDRDGFGWLARPPDAAPFDPTLHPYALDVPGNGVDENGLAGDLPAGFPAPTLVPVPEAIGPRRPNVLLIFLESFRDDLLDAEWNGRVVTPSLRALVEDGARARAAFVHSPYTVGSRSQFFGGTLTPKPGQETFVDDFLALGYEVAHFSGQNDAHAGSLALIGADRAHTFYDARSEPERRTSRSTNSVSLQVSWQTLLAQVDAYLDGRRSDRPLLLYVNIVDTHFPYHHGELVDLLGVDPLPRHDISVDRAEEVWATYATAAANVDRAIGRVVARFRERVPGDHAVLVTADHGQEIYDQRFLGHGALTRLQTQVPLVVVGIEGRWPEPLGLGDLRGLLVRDLFAAPSGKGFAFVPDPERIVPQFMPSVARPRLLGLQRLTSALRADLGAGRTDRFDGMEAPEPASEAEARELIHTWEALRVEAVEVR